MVRLQIPASVVLTLLMIGAADAEAAKSARSTSSLDRGRTLADYNIQKESAVQPPSRLRLAPK